MKVFIKPIVTIVSLFIIIWAAAALLRLNTVGTQMQAVHIAQGLALTPVFKIAVLEYQQNYGRLPASNEEAGLMPGNRYAKDSVQSVTIDEGGMITITYNEKSGLAGSRVQLVPSTSSTGRVSWDCRTSNFPSIQQLAPQCRYVK